MLLYWEFGGSYGGYQHSTECDAVKSILLNYILAVSFTLNLDHIIYTPYLILSKGIKWRNKKQQRNIVHKFKLGKVMEISCFVKLITNFLISNFRLVCRRRGITQKKAYDIITNYYTNRIQELGRDSFGSKWVPADGYCVRENEPIISIKFE
jgi:hypothetical protein